MTDFQTGLAIGASVGACVISVTFYVIGWYTIRKRERADTWPYRSEGHLW